MPEPAELKIIEKAKAGDPLAFRSLVETYQRFVYSIAFRFTGDDAEAEDLTQECFVKLWKNLARYNAEHQLKSWLGKMITNISLDFLKSARKQNEKNRTMMDERLPIPDPTGSEKELEASELHSLIMKLADQLTPKQRAAFILRDLEMLEVNEVCEMLGINAGNLKSNLYYARLHMKENLLKHYKTEWL
jgi:RNA polymerase sigma-70 factor (ECF subfamily)